MNSQIQVQLIQNSELTQSSQIVQVDSQLFESMLNQQQPNNQQNTEEGSIEQKTDKEESVSLEIKRSTDEDTGEDTPINLGPFLLEMINQETEIITQLGLSTEELDATMNKVLNGNKDLSPKEQKVIEALIKHLKAPDTDEQTQILTSIRDQDSDLKLQNPVFYQKQVLDNKHGNSEVLLEQSLSEQEPKDLERYLNQLNRNTFKDPKQLIENPKLIKPEIPSELSSEMPEAQSVLTDHSAFTLEKVLPNLNSETMVKEKSLLQTTQLVGHFDESERSIETSTESISATSKPVTNLRPVSNTLMSNSNESESSLETKSTVVETMNNSILYSRLVPEPLDTITTANQVIEKKELDVIKSMITEKIQNPGKTETLRSTIKLTPETLGKVTVEIEMVDNKLVGRLIVATNEAKLLVEQQLKSQTLIQPGQAVQLEKVEVSVMPVQNTFDAAFNFSDQQQSSHFSQPMKNKKGYTVKEEQELEGTETLELERNGSGRLNVMA
ncbi:flagellar hook-length control protein FliK [Marinilactibacillus sp. GCM10026970]|uniref:flagellar hook-length control protein FliK n=1 Tax=Marinilactibacillus sp. GCM10026970 TaxID=3252642 RepID=UPI00361AF906